MILQPPWIQEVFPLMSSVIIQSGSLHAYVLVLLSSQHNPNTTAYQHEDYNVPWHLNECVKS